MEILDYQGSSFPIKYKCLDCGSIYNLNEARRLWENKKVYCINCYNKQKKLDQVNNRCKEFDFTFIKYLDNKRIQLLCNKCNTEVDMSLYTLLYANWPHCPHCQNQMITHDEFLSLFDAKLKSKFSIINDNNYHGFKNSHILIKHNTCGFIFKTTPEKIFDSCKCPRCDKLRSKGETQIRDYLILKNIEYINEYAIQINNSIYFFDFYLPKLKLCIEFNGRQHYEPVDYFGGESSYQKQAEHDVLKKQWCKDHKIELLIISYKEQSKINEILECSTTIRKEQIQANRNGSFLEKEKDIV